METVAGDALVLLKLNQRIAYLTRKRDALQVQIEASRGMQTSEERLRNATAKFINSFTWEHFDALRTIARGRTPRKNQVLSQLFYWGCAGSEGMKIRGLRLSPIGRYALEELRKRFEVEDDERIGIWARYV